MSENLARHFLLRDDVVFLNHGSFGACPRAVFEAYQGWQLELERQPVAFLGRGPDRIACAFRALRWRQNSAQSADNIVGLVNATEGLNIVAQSLDLQPGDEIVTTDHEYSALEKTWAYMARRTGARVVVVKVPMPLVSEAEFTDAIVERIHGAYSRAVPQPHHVADGTHLSRSSDRSARRRREASGPLSTARTRPATSLSTSMPWMSISTPATVTSG